LAKDHPAQLEVLRLGDGCKDVAFTVRDATKAWEAARRNGAEVAYEPIELKDAEGSVTMAGIKTYGRVVHSFVSRTGAYDLEKVRKGGTFLPGFKPMKKFALNDYNRAHPCGLRYVDHCVGNVELGKMDHWVRWYEDVMGFALFKHFDDKDISTEYSALMSKVL